MDGDRHKVCVIKNFFLLSIMLLIPHFAFVFASLSSLAIGILSVVPVIFLSMMHSIANIRFGFEEFLVVVLITVLISLSALFGLFNSGDFKPLYFLSISISISISILILVFLGFFGYKFLADNFFRY
jgi:hypothetical protein